jgi:hypothetical protein
MGQLSGNAALSGNNFRYAGTVSATNTATYVFGIGGIKIGNQVDKLREELAYQYPMRSGLAWANVSVTFSTSQYLFVHQRQATITLDLIDYWPDTIQAYSGYNGYYLKPGMFILTSSSLAQKKNLDSYALAKAKLQQIQVDDVKTLQVKLADLKPGNLVLVNEGELNYPGIVETVDAQFESIHLKCLNAKKELIFKRVSYYKIKGLIIE